MTIHLILNKLRPVLGHFANFKLQFANKLKRSSKHKVNLGYIWENVIVEKGMWVKQNLKLSHGFHNTKKLLQMKNGRLLVFLSMQKTGFKWEDTRILKPEERRFDCKVREALEIQLQDTAPRNENGLNQDDGQYVTRKFWKPMSSCLRHKSLD